MLAPSGVVGRMGESSRTRRREQATLEEFTRSALATQCEAYADSTGERCQHDAMGPFPYCADHRHLLDAVDLERMGLSLSKSGG